MPMPSADDDNADPFANDDVQVVELSFMSNSDIQEELDRSVHSITQSDLSISAFEAELGFTPGRPAPHTPSSTPPLRPRNSGSLRRELPAPPQSRSSSPLIVSASSHVASPPGVRAGSPSSASPFRIASLIDETARAMSPLRDESTSLSNSASSSPMGSANGRSPRIRKEDVHRKLLRKRSIESPVPGSVLADAEPNRRSSDENDQECEAADATLDFETDDIMQPRSSALRRKDNYTYDGVITIDPEEQPIDPPRPNVLARAASAHDAPGQVQDVTTFRGLQFDISEGSGLDLGFSGMDFSGRVEIGEFKSALDMLVENVASGSTSNRPIPRGHARVESVTAGIPVQQLRVPTTNITDAEGADADSDVDVDAEDVESDDAQSSPSALLHGDGFRSMPISRSTSSASVAPPPPPPKDAIRSRELAILERRREMRRMQDDEAMGRTTPPRRSKRRSMSASDVDKPLRPMGPDRTESLDDVFQSDADADLEDVISHELRKRVSEKNVGNHC
jgi:hypothetical protein